VIATEVISDLIQMLAFDMLPNDAAVADHLAGALQRYCPKSDSILGVTSRLRSIQC